MTEVGINQGFLDSLTLDDIEMIEDAVDAPIDDVFAGKVAVKKTKLMKAIAFVLARRENPDVTFEDVGKLTMQRIGEMVAEVTAVPPTSAAG